MSWENGIYFIIGYCQNDNNFARALNGLYKHYKFILWQENLPVPLRKSSGCKLAPPPTVL